jgi:hypothetical protein
MFANSSKQFHCCKIREIIKMFKKTAICRAHVLLFYTYFRENFCENLNFSKTIIFGKSVQKQKFRENLPKSYVIQLQ